MNTSIEHTMIGARTLRTRKSTRKYYNRKNYLYQQDPFHLDILDRIRESQTRRRVSMLPRKNFEYYGKYEMVLPSNPALRTLPKTDVDSIVSRLNRPRNELFSSRINGEINNNGTDKEESPGVPRKRSIVLAPCRRCSFCHSPPSAFRTKHLSKTKKEIKDMVDRLSAAKLYGSDFQMGRLIHFPSVRSIDTGVESSTGYPSSTSYCSAESSGRIPDTLRSDFKHSHELRSRFPAIKPYNVDDDMPTLSVSVKIKDKLGTETEHSESVYASLSPRRQVKSRYSDRTMHTV